MSEWYCEELKNIIVYFDNWNDLINKINTIDYINQKNMILNFCKIHTENELKKWQELLNI
jgi:hypothetical protein